MAKLYSKSFRQQLHKRAALDKLVKVSDSIQSKREEGLNILPTASDSSHSKFFLQ